MYDLATVLPDAKLDPGSNILISGPPLTGKQRMGLDVVTSGVERGEGCIVVTTKDGGTKILDDIGDRLDEEPKHVGIVDCVTKQQGTGVIENDARIQYVTSPSDMTGIGIKFSERLTQFTETYDLERNRVLLHSVSTLLMYSDLQTVFRFLHVFTGRIQSTDAFGIFVVDSTAHDDQTMNTLKQLFDAEIEIEDGDGDDRRIHTAGIESA